jgi:predicted lipoprotein with Yx(FWY)xxD motif
MRYSLKLITIILMLISTISTNVVAIGLSSDRNYLVDGNGKPLYYFAKDDPNSGISNCYGGCSKIWIPLDEQAGSYVPAPLKVQDFSVILRADSVYQTTYKGQPLYTYSGDGSGTPNGNGKDSFWFLMRP